MSQASPDQATRRPTPGQEAWWRESVDLCSRLIRMDTRIGGPGERAAAEWVAASLADVGIEPTIVESEPGRANLLARVPGQHEELDPLLIQMHLDVVPAQPHEWTVHPLSGEVTGGYVWGRGAVDMKNMVAVVLAVIRHRMTTGDAPRRPLVLALFADEENGGMLGADWIVHHRPDLLDDCHVAIGECGGWSLPLGQGSRVYPIPVAEKGWASLEVSAHAMPSHASRVYDDNPVRVLAEAIGRLTHDRFPVHLTPQIEQLLRLVCHAHEQPFDPDHPETALPLVGFARSSVTSGLRHLAHATRVSAGYQGNVIPGVATAELDCRFLPGRWDEFYAELTAALGDQVQIRQIARTPGVAPSTGKAQQDLFAAAGAALQALDPSAQVAPFMLSGGTDATHLQRLGIECFGFNPTLFPDDLDFWALFHGVDERVPVDALHFGAQVLDRFLDLY